jgi:hypothetical protein
MYIYSYRSVYYKDERLFSTHRKTTSQARLDELSGSLVFAASFCEEWKRALKALSFRQLPLCECPNRNFIDLFYLMTFLRLQCLLSTRVSDSARVYISSAQQ